MGEVVFPAEMHMSSAERQAAATQEENTKRRRVQTESVEAIRDSAFTIGAYLETGNETSARDAMGTLRHFVDRLGRSLE